MLQEAEVRDKVLWPSEDDLREEMLRGSEKLLMDEKITIEITKEMGGVCCELTGGCNKQSIHDAIIALSKLIPRMAKSAQVNDEH